MRGMTRILLATFGLLFVAGIVAGFVAPPATDAGVASGAAAQPHVSDHPPLVSDARSIAAERGPRDAASSVVTEATGSAATGPALAVPVADLLGVVGLAVAAVAAVILGAAGRGEFARFGPR